VSGAETAHRELQLLLKVVKDEPTIPTSELAKRFGMSNYAVKTLLNKHGWHRIKGGPDGASPWHQDNGQPCPYDQTKIEVKPSKKTFDATLPDVIRDLGELLEGTLPGGEYVPESEVYQWADKQGVTDSMLAKAAKRLGVVKGKDGDIRRWALPPQPEDTAAGF
jgi:hypothetical protein